MDVACCLRACSGHGLLLVAAWQARPFLEAFVAAGAPLWVRAWWQAVFVEAFLPVAAWRLARECPPAARLAPFDRASTIVLGAALVCSVGLAAASAVSALDRTATERVAQPNHPDSGAGLGTRQPGHHRGPEPGRPGAPSGEPSVAVAPCEERGGNTWPMARGCH